MKKVTIEDLIKKLKLLYIQRYNALYNEDNHIKGNRLERQFTKIEEELIVSEEGVLALKKLLDDESEIVRCYVASTLISIYPKKCKEVLLKVQKGKTHLASDVKYILMNYEEGNNYFAKFLANSKN
ncbi:MAG: hypothetical protein E7374_01175 [Clostridiales bacterium]|nr:hypothetical protein [Clostridiales bacterium]